MSRSLDVCVVVYHSDLDWLTKTLNSLRAAIEYATQQNLLATSRVQVVDNGAHQTDATDIKAIIDKSLWAVPAPSSIKYAYVAAPANLGFGAGNNLALQSSSADFVLVLNPDVAMAPDSIANAIRYLDANATAGAVTPVATFPDGQAQFLVKRYPTVTALALRGFAPAWLKRHYANALAHYDYRDVSFDAALRDCRIVSGCWLLMRGEAWRRACGFDTSFFMYFEDFDLSARIATTSRIDRVIGCRIVHAGGNAAAKGTKHVGMFMRSAMRFFNKHGWRWW